MLSELLTKWRLARQVLFEASTAFLCFGHLLQHEAVHSVVRPGRASIHDQEQDRIGQHDDRR